MGSAQNVFYYGNGDEFDVASSGAFHLAESQAFIDGNKRTGLSTAIYFLARNGILIPQTETSNAVLYEAMMQVACHELDKAGLAALLRKLAS